MEQDKKRELYKGLIIDLIVYFVAFGIGIIPFIFVDNIFAATAIFTAVATLLVYGASVVFADVSIYDPYWSVAPPVMIIAVMLKYKFFNFNSFILLALICLWALRLTVNWLVTYKGIGHEDWRYAMYREKYSPVTFQLISFVGLHFVPTIVVYAGLIGGLFALQVTEFTPFSIIGIVVMIGAVTLELLSDRAIHKFLRESKGEKRTCNISVWKYSRHPNYLGEMSFWTGLYLYFVAVCPDIWYKGLGFLSIIALFLSVSIPMMEKHNRERRPDYEEYKAKTSMLLLLPPKKGKRKGE